MSDYNYLDEFSGGFAPQTGNTFPDLANLPDGDYDFTVMNAALTQTKNTSTDIIRLELRCEQTSTFVDKVYFPKDQENINRFAGDMGTLGFPVGTWTKTVPLSKAIPETVAALKGCRFKGTKKSNAKNGKTYHNLFINARLPTVDADTTQVHYANDEVGF